MGFGDRNDEPDLHDSYALYTKPLDISDAPPIAFPERHPLTITPPVGVTGKELFAFPGVNWFEFFRDSVVKVARDRLQEAHRLLQPLAVEPGWFDQADTIRRFFDNVKKDMLGNLSTLDEVLSQLEFTLTGQAKKYQSLNDAVSETVDGLGMDFNRALAAIEGFKDVNPAMEKPVLK